MEENRIYRLYINTYPTSGFTKGYGVVNSDRVVSENPEKDFYIQVPLMNNRKVIDYIDVEVDDAIVPIQRQEINPYYYEFGFFENINQIHINRGSDLTQVVIDYIRSVRFELANFSNQEVRRWFDAQGKNELPWNLPSGTITIDDLDKVQLNIANITSKANDLNIVINK